MTDNQHIDPELIKGCTEARDHLAYSLITEKYGQESYTAVQIVIAELDKAIHSTTYAEYDEHMDIAQYHIKRAKMYRSRGM